MWNRTRERAEALASDLGVRAVGEPEPADLLINCTSVGLEAACPAPVASGDIGDGDPRGAGDRELLSQLGLTFERVGNYPYVADMVYRADGPTPLLAAAAEHGARTLDGLEILLAQGAASFELWTGRAAPLQAMREGLHGGGNRSD